MKPTQLLTLAGVSALFAFTSVKMAPQIGGSKVILKSGSALAFKKEKKINLKFDYTRLKIGAFNSEEEYTAKKVADLNKKEKGKGDNWLKKWELAKSEYWPKRFEDMYNKVMGEKLGFKCSRSDTGNDYTLVVNVTFIEPGYNIGITKQPAYANMEFSLQDGKDNGNSLAELYVNNVIGADAMGFDFDTDKRVGESIAKASKMLCAFINKAKK